MNLPEGRPNDQYRADARLLAAAPLMLSFVELLADDYDDSDVVGREYLRQVAQQLLDKLEGK